MNIPDALPDAIQSPASVPGSGGAAAQTPAQASLSVTARGQRVASIWILDWQRHVCLMNAAARDCIARREGFLSTDGQLGLADPGMTRRLAHAVREVQARTGFQDAFCLPCPDGAEPLRVVVGRLIEAIDAGPGASHRVLVMATRASQVEGGRLSQARS